MQNTSGFIISDFGLYFKVFIQNYISLTLCTVILKSLEAFSVFFLFIIQYDSHFLTPQD